MNMRLWISLMVAMMLTTLSGLNAATATPDEVQPESFEISDRHHVVPLVALQHAEG